MFNCDDVGTLLAKRKQKFLSGFVHLDSIFCKIVAMISNWYPVVYYYSYFIIVSIIISLLFVVSLSWWRIKDVYNVKEICYNVLVEDMPGSPIGHNNSSYISYIHGDWQTDGNRWVSSIVMNYTHSAVQRLHPLTVDGWYTFCCCCYNKTISNKMTTVLNITRY